MSTIPYLSEKQAIENRPLSIVLADDHAMIRLGFKLLLKENFNISSIHEASTGDELYRIVKKHGADIIIMDIGMPGTNAQSILQNIMVINPDFNVLMFSVNKEEIYGKTYLALGARGYLHKDTPPLEVVRAIKCVLSGSLYIRKEMQSFYMGGGALASPIYTPYDSLGKKEMEVLVLLAKGDPPSVIAKSLNLSTSTISSHKASIFHKLKVRNILELKELTNIYPL